MTFLQRSQNERLYALFSVGDPDQAGSRGALGLFLLRTSATEDPLWESPFPHVYLLIKAAVDGAPANLHEPLGGDEHLVDPFPYREQR